MAEKQFEERRRANIIREVLLPVVVAVVTGIGASYVTTQVTIAIIETRLNYLEESLLAVRDLSEVIKSVQMDVVRITERAHTMGTRLNSLEGANTALTEAVKDRYTAKDAERDFNSLSFKIRNHNHIPVAPTETIE